MKNYAPKIALQLYSIHKYTGNTSLSKTLEDVAKIGYKGVEFAGYWGHGAKEIAAMLADNGLVACGTHVSTGAFTGDELEKSCEFCRECGFDLMICPGGGNLPPENWDGTFDDWMRHITAFYADAAEKAANFGCRIGLHNHAWEFERKLSDGTLYWDYFFANTPKNVCMEQDVGWTSFAGYNPCEQYAKFPGRSPTLHAKENGMDEPEFDAILGRPAKGVKGVEWEKLFPVAEKDGVEWFVVECERHFDSLEAVKPSYAFLAQYLTR
jgi:sugar phosphate isomerase/epimerase